MEKTAVRTPCSVQQMADAIRAAWTNLLGAPPSFDALCLAVAHSALETGYWKSMWNYNVGNAKSEGKAGDWTYYACGENLSNASAHDYVAKDPDHAKIWPTTQEPTAAKLQVIFLPKHSMCRFRAFASLTDAVADHMKMLRSDFGGAWPALAAGDPIAYVHALKAQRYFTAPEGPYAKGVSDAFEEVKKTLKAKPVTAAAHAAIAAAVALPPPPIPPKLQAPATPSPVVIPKRGLPGWVAPLVLLAGAVAAVASKLLNC